MGEKTSFWSALRHRDYRWLASAFVISNIGSWAYNVALIVWVFETTDSLAWVGAVSLARFVPALLFSAYGGVLAERFEKRNLVVVLNVTSALTHVGLALVVATDAPVVMALVLAALGTLQGTVYEPAIISLTPAIVGERDLAAANSLNGVIDNGAVIVGPAIGALMLLWFSPPVVLMMNAATFLYAALATMQVRERSTPADVTEGGTKGPLAQVMVGFRALRESQIARVLAGFSVAASFFYGTDTVLFVELSDARLGTGATGYGYLLTALGVGGIIAAPAINRLAARPDLGTIIATGMVVYTVPTAIMAVVDAPSVAFVLQVLRGAGTLVVDVLAVTAMQRTLPSELVSRVYGVYIALVLAAISLGALVVPVMTSAVGLNPSLLVIGLAPVAVVALLTPSLRAVNRVGAAKLAELAPRIAVFEASPLFSALARHGIEQLAAAATEVTVTAGTPVVVEGADADAVYVIADGAVTVTAHGSGVEERTVAELGAGDYFGEIGLLESAPRNATCTATTPSVLYRIDGDTFLEAVHETPQNGFLDRARNRAAQTHGILDDV